MSVQTTPNTNPPVERELKRNIRGQIVSYEIPASSDSTVDTPIYPKVYLTHTDGSGKAERLDKATVLANTDSAISELSFQLPTFSQNINVKGVAGGFTAATDLASSGFGSIGITIPGGTTSGGGGTFSGGGGLTGYDGTGTSTGFNNEQLVGGGSGYIDWDISYPDSYGNINNF